MNKCPDCGAIAPDDYHTCIEYERNRANDLQQQIEILSIELQLLRNRITELEQHAAGRTPWRAE